MRQATSGTLISKQDPNTPAYKLPCKREYCFSINMKFSRNCLLVLLVLVSSLSLIGCNSGGDNSGVDKPLTKDAGPPPPRPNKPTVKPSTGGGPAGTSVAP